MKDIEKLTELSNAIGVSVNETNIRGGCYYPNIKKIYVSESENLWRKLIICAHELGHAFQSPKEFELAINPDFEDKHEFIVAIERDAWVKAELILLKLYPNLPDEFWVDFNQFKEKCLDSYIMGSRIAVMKFDDYDALIFKHHNQVKPFCFDTFTFLTN